jgi:predicted RNase H-like nuclease (RuvC/YqgF family)
MARADNTQHLVHAAKRRHEDALARATEALGRLERARTPITFRSVAEVAGVSRGWLYRSPELRDAISARRSARPAKARATPAAERASTASLQRRLDALQDEAARLREENARLRDRIERLYGERRTEPLLGQHPDKLLRQ